MTPNSYNFQHNPEDIKGSMLVSSLLLAWDLTETDLLLCLQVSENKEVERS